MSVNTDYKVLLGLSDMERDVLVSTVGEDDLRRFADVMSCYFSTRNIPEVIRGKTPMSERPYLEVLQRKDGIRQIEAELYNSDLISG